MEQIIRQEQIKSHIESHFLRIDGSDNDKSAWWQRFRLIVWVLHGIFPVKVIHVREKFRSGQWFLNVVAFGKVQYKTSRNLSCGQRWVGLLHFNVIILPKKPQYDFFLWPTLWWLLIIEIYVHPFAKIKCSVHKSHVFFSIHKPTVKNYEQGFFSIILHKITLNWLWF